VAAALLFSTSCGPTTSQAAKQALAKGEEVVSGPASLRELRRGGKPLVSLPPKQFTRRDLQRRNRLLIRIDRVIATAAQRKVDRALARELTALDIAAKDIVYDSISDPRVTSAFMAHFAEVTKEAAVGVACEGVWDLVSGDPRLLFEGLSTDLRELANEVLNKLVARGFNSNQVRALVEWGYYADSVAEAADRFATNIGGDSNQPEVRLLTHPPMHRATMAYLRACYSPPHTLRP
jgi:hypothetical protein